MLRGLFQNSLFVGILLFFASAASAQPMVVYGVGEDLFVGTGDAGSFVQTNQGAGVNIGDLAIDPATRMIYYFDLTGLGIRVANSSGAPVGSITLASALIAPRNIRVSQGILYYSDTGYSAGTPQLRTVNLSSGAEGTLPVALQAGVDEFVIDTKNGRVIYGTDSSTSAVVESSKLDGTAVDTHFTPTTGTNSLEIYGDTLLRADFGVQGRITQFQLPGVDNDVIVRAGASGNGRPDDMASDFANGVYYYLDKTAVTGGLYRRTISATGSTDQTQIVALSNAGGLDVLEAESITLTPGTVISAPPVLLSKTANSITIRLLQFAAVSLPSGGKKSRAAITRGNRLLAAAAKPTFQYEVRVKPSTGKARSLTSKKNELTVKNLKPGNYNVDYRATILVKKTAAQRQKAEAAGKKGIALKFNKKGSTNFSPPLQVTLP